MAGFMDELNKAASKLQELGGKAIDGAKEMLDKTDIDEKIIGAAKDLKDKAQEALNKTDIDEKIVDAAKGLKDKAQEALDKTDIDEKIVDAAKGLKDKAVETFGKAAEGVKEATEKAPAPKDAMDQIKDEVAEQFEKIRSAATGSDPIHAYMQKQQAEEAPAPEAPAAEGLKSFADQAQAAAEKVSDAAEKAQATVDAKAQDIADRAQNAFDQASN